MKKNILLLIFNVLILLNSCTSIEESVANGNLNKIEQYLSSGKSINDKFENELTLLMYASKYGETEIVDYLIRNNADILKIDSTGKTALMYALLNNNLEIAKKYLETEESISQIKKSNINIYLHSLSKGYSNIVQYLIDINLQKPGILWKSRTHNGIIGIYNPSKNIIEWKNLHRGGVAGVYNPNTKEIEWREKTRGGIAGVYNPNTKEIEWREKTHGGIAGVYNPNTKEIEWREKTHGGIAGVYNPNTKKIEWKDKSYGGIAGVYNPITKKIEWSDKYQGGVCAVSVYEDYPTTASYSFPGKEKK